MTVNRLVFAEFMLPVHLGVSPYVCTSVNFVFKFSLGCTVCSTGQLDSYHNNAMANKWWGIVFFSHMNENSC